MKINKQLFEDVLSGKLKGTFVKKAGGGWESKYLHKCPLPGYPYCFEYGCLKQAYSETGKQCTLDGVDIIDFIPETDMKENELIIEIPDGKIVDWEESKKQNKIVLKDKQLTYEDICEKLFKDDHYTIAWEGYPIGCCSGIYNASNATTEHQLECILAKNKLANVAVYLNDGWKPSKDKHVFTITHYGDSKDNLIISEHYFGTGENLVLFKTQKAAKQAIEILGEETVKLALEPLGI